MCSCKKQIKKLPSYLKGSQLLQKQMTKQETTFAASKDDIHWS